MTGDLLVGFLWLISKDFAEVGYGDVNVMERDGEFSVKGEGVDFVADPVEAYCVVDNLPQLLNDDVY